MDYEEIMMKKFFLFSCIGFLLNFNFEQSSSLDLDAAKISDFSINFKTAYAGPEKRRMRRREKRRENRLEKRGDRKENRKARRAEKKEQWGHHRKAASDLKDSES